MFDVAITLSKSEVKEQSCISEIFHPVAVLSLVHVLFSQETECVRRQLAQQSHWTRSHTRLFEAGTHVPAISLVKE